MRGHCLEVFYGLCVNVDGNLLLQTFSVWVLLRCAEIILFSHVNHLIPIETDSAKHKAQGTVLCVLQGTQRTVPCARFYEVLST